MIDIEESECEITFDINKKTEEFLKGIESGNPEYSIDVGMIDVIKLFNNVDGICTTSCSGGYINEDGTVIPPYIDFIVNGDECYSWLKMFFSALGKTINYNWWWKR